MEVKVLKRKKGVPTVIQWNGQVYVLQHPPTIRNKKSVAIKLRLFSQYNLFCGYVYPCHAFVYLFRIYLMAYYLHFSYYVVLLGFH